MLGLNDDADSLGAFYFADWFSDLQRQLVLNLKTSSKHVDNLSHFLETQCLAVWQIGYVVTTNEGEEVELARRVELDVLE